MFYSDRVQPLVACLARGWSWLSTASRLAALRASDSFHSELHGIGIDASTISSTSAEGRTDNSADDVARPEAYIPEVSASYTVTNEPTESRSGWGGFIRSTILRSCLVALPKIAK
ncbi:hypothetical protein RRG08_060134 [Elysia crispata]|uniref:Uncharacterized protein n=1 Tax=Elysia crispata TaxID=231223 RepID=A0AAE0ZZN6_9GAST|nr:hypothetical protein RRG08_060134 [Elysia crispata]